MTGVQAERRYLLVREFSHDAHWSVSGHRLCGLVGRADGDTKELEGWRSRIRLIIRRELTQRQLNNSSVARRFGGGGRMYMAATRLQTSPSLEEALIADFP